MGKASAHLLGLWDMAKVMVSLAMSQPRAIAVKTKRSIDHPGMIANEVNITQMAVEAAGTIQAAIMIDIHQRDHPGESEEAQIVVIDEVTVATGTKDQDIGMMRGTGITDGGTAAGNVECDGTVQSRHLVWCSQCAKFDQQIQLHVDRVCILCYPGACQSTNCPAFGKFQVDCSS